MTSIKGIKRTKASHKSILGSPGSRLKRLKAKRRGNEDPPGNSLEFEQADDCNQRSNRSTGSLANLLEKAGNSASLEVDHGAVPTYFTQRASTSCKSVAELGISLANESELRASVATLPERLSEEKSILVEKYLNGVRKMASQWRAGFSLLFYGYGSKFNLLRLILKECCAGFPAVLIDGLSQRVSYRSILMNILAVSRDCKPSNFSSMSDEDLLQEIREETTHQRIFVMVSNIDGPALRNYRDQRSLSELASIPRLHFGASIDHVNAPLIWDLQTKDRFSWSWNHVPTFVPYIREVNHSSLPSLFLGRKYVFLVLHFSACLASFEHYFT